MESGTLPVAIFTFRAAALKRDLLIKGLQRVLELPQEMRADLTLGYRSKDESLILVVEAGTPVPELGKILMNALQQPNMQCLELQPDKMTPVELLKAVHLARNSCDASIQVTQALQAVTKMREIIQRQYQGRNAKLDVQQPIRFRLIGNGTGTTCAVSPSEIVIATQDRLPPISAEILIDYKVGDGAASQLIATVLRHEASGTFVCKPKTAETQPEPQKQPKATPSRLLHLELSQVEDVQREYRQNISCGGLFIPTSNPPDCGSAVTAELRLPNGELVRFTAEVVYIVTAEEAKDGQPCGCGIQFGPISAATQRIFAQYLDSESPSAQSGEITPSQSVSIQSSNPSQSIQAAPQTGIRNRILKKPSILQNASPGDSNPLPTTSPLPHLRTGDMPSSETGKRLPTRNLPHLPTGKLPPPIPEHLTSPSSAPNAGKPVSKASSSVEKIVQNQQDIEIPPPPKPEDMMPLSDFEAEYLPISLTPPPPTPGELILPPPPPTEDSFLPMPEDANDPVLSPGASIQSSFKSIGAESKNRTGITPTYLRSNSSFAAISLGSNGNPTMPPLPNSAMASTERMRALAPQNLEVPPPYIEEAPMPPPPIDDPNLPPPYMDDPDMPPPYDPAAALPLEEETPLIPPRYDESVASAYLESPEIPPPYAESAPMMSYGDSMSYPPSVTPAPFPDDSLNFAETPLSSTELQPFSSNESQPLSGSHRSHGYQVACCARNNPFWRALKRRLTNSNCNVYMCSTIDELIYIPNLALCLFDASHPTANLEEQERLVKTLPPQVRRLQLTDASQESEDCLSKTRGVNAICDYIIELLTLQNA